MIDFKAQELLSHHLLVVLDDHATGSVGGRCSVERIGTSFSNGHDAGCSADAGRDILNGVVLGHGLGKAGVDVSQSVEAVFIGGQPLDGDGQHHWRHVGREQRAPLQLAKGGID